ncbi:hypothetical protein BC829DRAFT_379780 [Chytridium lagenaria]|nr:hypothetical protein BC829DRAFT_379780 [Chytridium lagenaria]
MLIPHGDDAGLVKTVHVRPKDQKPALKKPRLSNTDKKRTPPPPTIPLPPKMLPLDRTMEVQMMALTSSAMTSPNGRPYVMAALKSGSVREVRTIKAPVDTETFIGLHESRGTIITCTSKGNVTYHPRIELSQTNGDTRETDSVPTFSTSLGLDKLCRMRVFPGNPNIFATGGDERDLTIWDVSGCGKEDGAAPKEIWKAKNFKHVRVYDVSPKSQTRRPVVSVEIGEHPLKHLAIVPGKRQAVITDTIGTLTHVDLDNGKKMGSYRGCPGAVSSIYVMSKLPQVAVSVLDRYVRVFQLEGERRLLSKIYLKQRLTCLAIDEDYVLEEVSKGNEDEPGQKRVRAGDDDDVEDMLEGLDEVQ